MTDTINKDDFRKLIERYRDAVAVVDSGMPQATEKEVRAMNAHVREMKIKLENCPWMENRHGDVVWKNVARRFVERVQEKLRHVLT